MSAAEETVTKFHHKCHSKIILSDNNTAAAGDWPGTVFNSVPLHQLHNNRFVFKTKTHHKCQRDVTLSDNNTAAAAAGGWTGTVFSSVPLHQLRNNRFVFIINKRDHRGVSPIYQIGVTRSDPGDLQDIPGDARRVPQTWFVCPHTGERWENSRKVDTKKVTKVTPQEGDVWCVEVTPGGQVYIYHNYNQPWGSPVFTLPPDTTQVWAVVTLIKSTISVVQNPDIAVTPNINSLLWSLLCQNNSEERKVIEEELSTYIEHVKSSLYRSGVQRIYQCVVDLCADPSVSCVDVRRLLVEGGVIEILRRSALSWKMPTSEFVFTCLGEPNAAQFLTRDKRFFLEWYESLVKSEYAILVNILTFINLCGQSQIELYFPEVDEMLVSFLNYEAKNENKSSMNSLDDKGWAPLHYTAHCGLPLATRQLLSVQDINVNLKNREGNTALHLAVKSIPDISTNCIDTLGALLIHHDIDLSTLDHRVQLHFLEGLNTSGLHWKDNLGRSLGDCYLHNIDRDGWDRIRPFIKYIIKHNSWTGHKILPDENTTDAISPNSNISEDRSSHSEYCHHSFQESSMKTWEWLLAVDEAIRIPGHTQQSSVYQRDVTQGIGRTNICEKCDAESRDKYLIAEAYGLKAKEEMQGKFPDLHFALQAIGSYIQDLKILSPNEFDFLLIINKHCDDEGQMCDDCQKYAASWFAEQSELVRKREHSDPTITSVYRHGPAWCLEFTLIKNGVELNVGVDITLAVRHVGTSMKGFSEKIQGHRYFDYVYRTLTEDAMFVNLGPDKHGLTSCTIMMKLIAKLSYMVPHVATVIRIVKLLVHVLFPKRIIYCEMKHSMMEDKAFFSSHTIVSLVLRHLDVNIDDQNPWTSEQLPSTVRSVMKMLKDKMLSTEMDYLLSENVATEKGIFNFIDSFLQSHEFAHETCPCSPDTFKSYFAIVKVGSFVKVRTEKELIELCRPSSTSVDRPTVLAYIIPDHPLLQTDSKYPILSQLMCHFRSYLYNNFKDLPVKD